MKQLVWSGVLLAALGGAAADSAAQESTPPGVPVQSEPAAASVAPDVFPVVAVTEAERATVQVMVTDLDLHLSPAEARLEGHAVLTLKNVSAGPVGRLALQVSGSLRWQIVSGAQVSGWTQSPIATDTDHTGYAQEAVITLKQPLAAGATVSISTFYAGEIRQSSARLELLGADPGKTAETEWDAIRPTADDGATALRGFGDVIWYPVAAPTAALGDGNKLFELVASERRRNTTASVRLRLTVEYIGDPPDAAIFEGELRPLTRLPDEDNTLTEATHGVATADFSLAKVGFRSLSLFLTAQPAAASADRLLSLVTPVPEAAEPYSAAGALLKPLMAEWLGANPLTPLTLLDHPGTPFEDGAFLAAHLSANADPKAIAPALVRGMTHAWIRSDAVWLDEGLPELMALLYIEKTAGRAAALDVLRQASVGLALVDTGTGGQALVSASSDIYVRRKSAAVLWQLKELLGEEKFARAVQSFRKVAGGDGDTERFRYALEKSYGADLGWFFADWVTRDAGLPDLTIAHVAARPELTSKSAISGYLVAVEVKNAGDAVADVPVTVRSAAASVKERVRVAAHSSASVRIFLQSLPDVVEVNDGSVPEMQESLHSAAIEGASPR